MTEKDLNNYQRQIMPPVGDFIALIGGFLAIMFPVFLHWYSIDAASPKPGIFTAVGILAFMLGIAVVVLALIMLIGRFNNPHFRISKSPGWLYASAASAIFMVSILGLAVRPSFHGAEYGVATGIILELFAAVIIGVGGMFKFDGVPVSADVAQNS